MPREARAGVGSDHHSPRRGLSPWQSDAGAV